MKLSDRVEVEWFKQVSPISETAEDEIAVSGIDSIAAARVTPQGAAPFAAPDIVTRPIPWLEDAYRSRAQGIDLWSYRLSVPPRSSVSWHSCGSLVNARVGGST